MRNSRNVMNDPRARRAKLLLVLGPILLAAIALSKTGLVPGTARLAAAQDTTQTAIDPLAPGEEPTIHIKGGSVFFELVERDKKETTPKWTDAGHGRWTHDGRQSKNRHYRGRLVPNPTMTCKGIAGPLRVVFIHTSDDQSVMLSFVDARTQVQPIAGALRSSADQQLELELGQGQFVNRIEFLPVKGGGFRSCTFSKDAFKELILCDTTEPCK